MLYTDQRR